MTPIPTLIQKLESASEGSRELDALIFRSLGAPLPDRFANLKVDLEWQEDGSATMPVGDMRVRYEPPAFSTSLDAALALVERKLPGRMVELGRYTDDDEGPAGCFARVSTYCQGDGPRWEDEDRGEGATLPVALCIALLRALTQQPGDGQ